MNSHTVKCWLLSSYWKDYVTIRVFWNIYLIIKIHSVDSQHRLFLPHLQLLLIWAHPCSGAALTLRLLKTCLSAITDEADILKPGEQAAPPGLCGCTTFHWELRDKQSFPVDSQLEGFSTLLISHLWKKPFSISNLWEKRATWRIMCLFCLRRQLSLQKWWGGSPRAK